MKGVIIKSTGSWYSVLAMNGKKIDCRIKGVFRIKGIKNTNPVTVGDRVEFDMDDDKETGVINKIEQRKNYIIRKSINLSKQTHIIASNIDRAFLVVTLALPKTSTGFIDRFLVTAEAYGIPAAIVFNKKDIYTDEGLQEVKRMMSLYENIGYPCYFISAFNSKDIKSLQKEMKDKVSLVSGHSGVGKSTLINALDPSLHLKVGEISETHLKGMHTTTFAEMHPMPFGGFIIDTPGIKELGLVDMEKSEVSHFFPEMRSRMQQCKFNNCQHLNEPQCAVIEAVEKENIAPSRYHSYLSIMNGEELIKEYDD